MSDFFSGAFPFIVIGIALALFAANHVKEKKNAQQEDDEAQGNRMTEGMCFGMCAGVVLGSMGVCDLGIGISLGMLVGETIGMFIKK